MRTTPGNLTISQVNSMLDSLSLASKEYLYLPSICAYNCTSSNQIRVFREEQLPIMTEFYNNMNASELMWLIRIIMRRMVGPSLM